MGPFSQGVFFLHGVTVFVEGEGAWEDQDFCCSEPTSWESREDTRKAIAIDLCSPWAQEAPVRDPRWTARAESVSVGRRWVRSEANGLGVGRPRERS